MNYPHIVSVIDLQIERLQQARALLLESTAPSAPSVEIPVTGAPSPQPEGTSPSRSQASEAPAVVARRVAPRLRSTPRRARQHVAEPTALSGALPTGPVFIPAAQVHLPAAAVNPAPKPAETRPGHEADAEDGSLEALLRQSGQNRGHHTSPEAQAREFFGV